MPARRSNGISSRDAIAYEAVMDAVVIEKWLEEAASAGQVPTSLRRYQIMHDPETKAACIAAVEVAKQRRVDLRGQRKIELAAQNG